MNKRKALINEYKERKRRGCVYLVTNINNGKYLIGHSANVQSEQNKFQFACMTGTAFHPRLRKDWKEVGTQDFTLKVLEELEQKPDQGQEAFMDDLKALEQLWRATLDPAQEY
ncbi:GIY-YIG nuclease family protein [Ktedonobacter racemifer]|uniref:ArsR family transcriptional regulator n=1 Tax=Ktedonobacter racemifer DSM 44963 TaxID=485913 RepID=D6TW20_KTERA|nr:GIY-YIG nuclease family protein [Ktedonobacter racemifer]EFH84403.1 ArsR family transcriptional regulator [Ktedonobacter racemifer DSM 44963]